MGGRSIACLNARDRNLLGFRRDLLTASAYGVDQFLFVYGDEPLAGSRTSKLTVRTMLAEGRPDRPRHALRGGHRAAPAPCVEAGGRLPLRADRLLPRRPARLAGPGRGRRPRLRRGHGRSHGSPPWRAISPRRSPGLTVPVDLVERLEHDRNAGVDAACDLVAAIRDSGAFEGVHLIPVARYREVSAASGASAVSRGPAVRCRWSDVSSSLKAFSLARQACSTYSATGVRFVYTLGGDEFAA